MALRFALLFAVAGLSLMNCSAPPVTCSAGCADMATQTCHVGTEAAFCGAVGSTCQACTAGQACSKGACVSGDAGTGGGSGAGGGSAGGGTAGGGSGVDAGPTTVCTSNQLQSGSRYIGAVTMNPGLACKACHSGQNFMNQNPSVRSATRDLWSFMGTVYPTLHEKDFCISALPAGVTVEIIGVDGGVLTVFDAATNANSTSMGVFSTGNFLGDVTGSIPPYRARVRANGKTREMQGFQTDGDCNSCHTEQGANGAPGRIAIPE